MGRKTGQGQGDATGQRDLFDERPQEAVSRAPPSPPDLDVSEGLTDRRLLEMIPKANLSNVQPLCDEALDRDLGDEAVPALEALWHRFRGYGHRGALPEQRCAVETLAQISTPPAREVLTRIVRATHPDPVLLTVLQAAVAVGLSLPLRQVEPWLDHELPEVRVCAYTLVRKANPPAHVLQDGLTDPYPAVRRAALISAGMLGHGFAKPGLLVELDRNPSSRIVEALVGIMDDDILVRLGKCAVHNEVLRPVILDELRDSENPRARKIASNIEAGQG